jgi:adenine phosphoribosyltransferase
MMTTTETKLQYIKSSIKTIPDYPKPGIMFRDITSLVEDARAFGDAIDLLVEMFKNQGVTKVVGTEARGFIFGAPIAVALGLGFIPVRKPNKLPRNTIAQRYELEYGSDCLELHEDAIHAGDRVLVIDDLLATGGTVEATIALIRHLGGEVTDAAFVINLPDLGGQDRLESLGVKVTSLVEFEGD